MTIHHVRLVGKFHLIKLSNVTKKNVFRRLPEYRETDLNSVSRIRWEKEQ